METVVQKKNSNKHTFTFYEDYFNFAYKDKNGSGDVDIHYADLSVKPAIHIEQNEWLRNVGLLWMVLGSIQLGHAVYTGASLSGKGFWIVIGVICFVWYRASKVKYTILRSQHANAFVIQGKDHDRIIKEITTRRKNQLLKLFGDINPANSLEEETRKFRWLAEQDVITVEEAEQKIAQAELLRKKEFAASASTLN